MPTYRLHYFDVRGRGEQLRMLFHAAGKKFDDVRLTADQWKEFKPKTPFGQMPVLEIDGKLYGQSGAIAQFLAREFGLYGKNNIDALNIDVVTNCVKDFAGSYVAAMFEKDEALKKEKLAKLSSESVPKFLSQMEHLISSSGYFVGNSVTLADIAVYDMEDNLLNNQPDALSKYPKLTAHRRLMETKTPLASYLKSRK